MVIYWICAAITAASAYVSLGFSVAAVRAESRDTVGARYALARSIALAVVATIAFFAGSVAFVVASAAAMVLVQACDAVIGRILRDLMKTVGPTVFAAANLAALIWLLVIAR